MSMFLLTCSFVISYSVEHCHWNYIHILKCFIVKIKELTFSHRGFIFTMPNILRYGSTSEFCLTLHGDDQSQNVTMALVKEGTHALEVHSIFPIGKSIFTLDILWQWRKQINHGRYFQSACAAWGFFLTYPNLTWRVWNL